MLPGDDLLRHTGAGPRNAEMLAEPALLVHRLDVVAASGLEEDFRRLLFGKMRPFACLRPPADRRDRPGRFRIVVGAEPKFRTVIARGPELIRSRRGRVNVAAHAR